jgi:hypothetical protein
MTPGERRLAQRLESKLDDDYLLWYDVPVGPQHLHPDFIILHPSAGLFVLEVKDWKLDTFRVCEPVMSLRSLLPTAPSRSKIPSTRRETTPWPSAHCWKKTLP